MGWFLMLLDMDDMGNKNNGGGPYLLQEISNAFAFWTLETAALEKLQNIFFRPMVHNLTF
jgi:hypothetical protein